MGLGRKHLTNDSESVRLKNIAIFASGAGSNAQKIIQYFNNNLQKTANRVALIVSNNSAAGIVDIAQKEGIPLLILEKERFLNGDGHLPELKSAGIDFIVLAGFLWKVPVSLIRAYPGAIINIHPALLPHYGGKGMYGRFVHEAVLANNEKESGITIHYVDELYDHGSIIQQFKCPVLPADTATSLAERVQALEHAHYAPVIESVIK
ncbi:MAG: phosphoribosylglycinamide formyltransferase [Bacteroidetes bacterium]|nr:phosphoribosylglycinamide formyltransferase [Bacteroidota bacterium]